MGRTRTSRRSAGGSEGCAWDALLVVAVWLGGCDGIRGEVLTLRPDATVSDLSGDDAQADASGEKDGATDDRASRMDAAEASAGCRIDGDCAGDPRAPVCEPASGRCVACRPEPDGCAAYLHCDPIQRLCVEGCRSDEGCAGSSADGGVADGGGVAARVCDTAVHQCVQCREDGHCPTGLLCAGQRCVPGCSATQACPSGAACCEGACVDRETDPSNCGACGTVCAVTHGAPGCSAGRCTVAACADGFGDCDGAATNGCEADVTTTAAHCGTCATVCPTPANGTASCNAGACDFTCSAGFHGCDAACASDTAVSSCGARCTPCAAPAHATATCDGAACGFMCDDGFVPSGASCVPRCTLPIRRSLALPTDSVMESFESDSGAGAPPPACRMFSDLSLNRTYRHLYSIPVERRTGIAVQVRYIWRARAESSISMSVRGTCDDLASERYCTGTGFYTPTVALRFVADPGNHFVVLNGYGGEALSGTPASAFNLQLSTFDPAPNMACSGALRLTSGVSTHGDGSRGGNNPRGGCFGLQYDFTPPGALLRDQRSAGPEARSDRRRRIRGSGQRLPGPLPRS